MKNQASKSAAKHKKLTLLSQRIAVSTDDDDTFFGKATE